MKANRILICSTCRPDGGAKPHPPETLRAQITGAIAAAGLDHAIDVGCVACMGACEAPMALAFQGKARATLVFAGVRPDDDMADIVSTCRAYLDAPAGWIEDARACGRLRLLLRARVPAIDSA